MDDDEKRRRWAAQLTAELEVAHELAVDLQAATMTKRSEKRAIVQLARITVQINRILASRASN